MLRATVIAAVLALGLCACGDEQAAGGAFEDTDALEAQKAGFPESEEAVARGAAVYRKHCALCHGDEGKGDGGSAPYLDPRPRDFTKNLMKFRSTKSGELPTDADLYRIISRGIPGTAMPAWGEGVFQLTEEQRWDVSYFLKTLIPDFEDEELSPYIEDRQLAWPEAPDVTDERIANGKAIFTDTKRGGCVKCHGVGGRGNGEQAGAQRDDWGDDILAADLTKPWRTKNGTSARQLYRTFSTGVNGTPMPGYGESLSEDERWDLAFFVESLQVATTAGQGQVLLARRADGEIPGDPQAEAWTALEPLDIPLMGQVVVRPRHHNPTVDLVSVRAMYDDEEIAFHLSWNDRTQSVDGAGAGGLEAIDDTFVPAKTLWKRRKAKLPDSLQLQFPTKPAKPGSPDKPFFLLGGSGGDVSLWRWFADREASGEGRAFEARLQNGARNEPEVRADEVQTLGGKATFDDGRWSLIIRRSRTGVYVKQTDFLEGELVPFALQVWDGGNGEAGLVCSVSSWYHVRLDTPIPTSAWLAGLAGLVVALLLMRLLSHLASARPVETILTPSPERGET